MNENCGLKYFSTAKLYSNISNYIANKCKWIQVSGKNSFSMILRLEIILSIVSYEKKTLLCMKKIFKLRRIIFLIISNKSSNTII